jgi:hypothetical protein
MNILVWLILVSSAGPIPRADARRFRITARSPRHSRRGLSDRDIVDALSRLISDQNEEEESSQFATEMETEMKNEKLREGRQFDGFASANGDCEITGFETNIREECEEVSTIECKKVNVTEFRTEIKPRCKTLFDQKCNVTYNDVPTQKCSPRKRNR